MILAALALQLTPITAEGRWAAFEFDTHCEARVRAWRTRSDPVEQPRLTFSFRDGGGIELHANLRRVSREGSTAMLHIDGQPNLMSVEGRNAWSTGGEAGPDRLRYAFAEPAQYRRHRSLGAALSSIIIRSTEMQTAIDAAAACAAKKAGN